MTPAIHGNGGNAFDSVQMYRDSVGLFVQSAYPSAAANDTGIRMNSQTVQKIVMPG
jgi:hypothetical protein